ncbi:hypothetical protein M405DRAFT_868473 [Rhizopogon salebrosus TDB-379]|nr:hypothetical protein M405DRAFT_868473 [Rhizopogon salebrosus TDB-379]
MSDDEDEEVPRKPRRKKASDSERSLEAMMDIDDDQVIKMSRLSSHRPDDDVDDTADEIDLTDADVPISSAAEEEGDEEEEEEEEDFKPQAKKKKPKKVAPIGRNGLKKRRVMKSRTTTDTKGYMQTEDYSSYESVSEEDTVPKDAKKLKGKKKAETKLKDEEKEKPVQANPKIKETNSSRPKAKTGKPPKREGLLNFFGPDKTKK